MKKQLFFVFAIFILLSACKKEEMVSTSAPVPVNVFNKGVSGNTTGNLLNRMADATSENPDLVIIMIGTNDTAFGDSTFSKLEGNLSIIIDRIKAMGSAVMLLTPPPALTSSPSFQYLSRLDSACSIIRKLSISKSCYLVDINQDFKLLNYNQSLYLNDGLHPDKAGYIDLTGFVYSYLKANNVDKKTIVCFGDSITFGYEVDGQGTTNGDTYPAVLKRSLNQ